MMRAERFKSSAPEGLFRGDGLFQVGICLLIVIGVLYSFGCAPTCDPGWVQAIGDAPGVCCPEDAPYSTPDDPYCHASETGGGGSGTSGSGGDSYSSPTVVGCDSVLYKGHLYTNIGCEPGILAFHTTIMEGAHFASFQVYCSGGCVSFVIPD